MIDLTLTIPGSAVPWLDRHRGLNTDTERYRQSLVDDYKMILPFLPEKVDRILDIGCGLAGIDVLLRRHYPEAELWLLDGDGDEPRAGWNPFGLGAFSSRAAAEEMLLANWTGENVAAPHWVDVGTKEVLSADLVISLASWGYHYPLSTYKVRGFCIADLRAAKEPARGKVIASINKYNRCAWHQS